MRVLLIDDDEPLCSVMRRNLPRHGIEVQCAGSIAAAMQLLREGGPNAFDAAVVDLLLPDGDGMSLTTVLKGCGVPALVASGYYGERAHEVISHNTLGIPKPYKPAALAKALRELLARHAQNDLRFGEHYNLSGREVEVIALSAKGLGLIEIAEELGCSVRSVREYWDRACKKLNAPERRTVIALYWRFHTW